MKQQTGFTLIEILVVLAIISIVSCVALLSINLNQDKNLEAFAADLSQTLSLAQEKALLEANVIGLSLNQQAVNVVELKNKTWVLIKDQSFAKKQIPSDLEMRMTANKTNPQVIISTNGDISPFEIYLGKKGAKPRYLVKGDESGNVTTQFLA